MEAERGGRSAPPRTQGALPGIPDSKDDGENPRREMLLCGDIDGHSSRLVLYAVNSDTITSEQLRHVAKEPSLARMTLTNSGFDNFADVVRSFLIRTKFQSVKIVAGCLAVAGPVEDDRATLSHRDGWTIDARRIEEEFMIAKGSLRVINDFAASGFGVLTLDPHEYEELGDPVRPTPGAPIAVVGAGIGLGEAYVTNINGKWETWASEGGHADFSPQNKRECGLLRYLFKKYGGRVSTERVVSQKGIVNVWEFLAQENPSGVDASFAKKVQADYADRVNVDYAGRGADLIRNACYDDAMCKETLNTVMAAYGCEAGNCVVRWLPFGGLYVTGTIALANSDFVKGRDSPFMTAYRDRGRMSGLISKVPLRLVHADDLGLRGAHYMALRTRLQDTEIPPEPLRAKDAREPMPKLADAVLLVRDAVRAGTIAVGALTVAVVGLALAKRRLA